VQKRARGKGEWRKGDVDGIPGGKRWLPRGPISDQKGAKFWHDLVFCCHDKRCGSWSYPLAQGRPRLLLWRWRITIIGALFSDGQKPRPHPVIPHLVATKSTPLCPLAFPSDHYNNAPQRLDTPTGHSSPATPLIPPKRRAQYSIILLQCAGWGQAHQGQAFR